MPTFYLSPIFTFPTDPPQTVDLRSVTAIEGWEQRDGDGAPSSSYSTIMWREGADCYEVVLPRSVAPECVYTEMVEMHRRVGLHFSPGREVVDDAPEMAELRKCRYCPNMTANEEQPDPYQEYVYGDDAPLVMCDRCYAQQCNHAGLVASSQPAQPTRDDQLLRALDLVLRVMALSGEPDPTAVICDPIPGDIVRTEICTFAGSVRVFMPLDRSTISIAAVSAATSAFRLGRADLEHVRDLVAVHGPALLPDERFQFVVSFKVIAPCTATRATAELRRVGGPGYQVTSLHTMPCTLDDVPTLVRRVGCSAALSADPGRILGDYADVLMRREDVALVLRAAFDGHEDAVAELWPALGDDARQMSITLPGVGGVNIPLRFASGLELTSAQAVGNPPPRVRFEALRFALEAMSAASPTGNVVLGLPLATSGVQNIIVTPEHADGQQIAWPLFSGRVGARPVVMLELAPIAAPRVITPSAFTVTINGKPVLTLMRDVEIGEPLAQERLRDDVFVKPEPTATQRELASMVAVVKRTLGMPDTNDPRSTHHHVAIIADLPAQPRVLVFASDGFRLTCYPIDRKHLGIMGASVVGVNRDGLDKLLELVQSAAEGEGVRLEVLPPRIRVRASEYERNLDNMHVTNHLGDIEGGPDQREVFNRWRADKGPTLTRLLEMIPPPASQRSFVFIAAEAERMIAALREAEKRDLDTVELVHRSAPSVDRLYAIDWYTKRDLARCELVRRVGEPVQEVKLGAFSPGYLADALSTATDLHAMLVQVVVMPHEHDPIFVLPHYSDPERVEPLQRSSIDERALVVVMPRDMAKHKPKANRASGEHLDELHEEWDWSGGYRYAADDENPFTDDLDDWKGKRA